NQSCRDTTRAVGHPSAPRRSVPPSGRAKSEGDSAPSKSSLESPTRLRRIERSALAADIVRGASGAVESHLANDEARHGGPHRVEIVAGKPGATRQPVGVGALPVDTPKMPDDVQ